MNMKNMGENKMYIVKTVKTIKVSKRIKAKIEYIENERIYYVCFDYKGKHGTITGGGKSPKFNSKEEAIEWCKNYSNLFTNEEYLYCLAKKRGLDEATEEFYEWINKRKRK